MSAKRVTTPSDITMENLAVLDLLEREGYSESIVDRIERAVNAHEEMLRSLKDAVTDLESLYNHSKVYGKFEVSLGMWRRLAAMKAAIAKAEKGDK